MNDPTPWRAPLRRSPKHKPCTRSDLRERRAGAIIDVLAKQEEPISARAIAGQIGIDPTTVELTLDYLAELKAVVRSKGPYQNNQRGQRKNARWLWALPPPAKEISR